jgi:hypothetical protein
MKNLENLAVVHGFIGTFEQVDFDGKKTVPSAKFTNEDTISYNEYNDFCIGQKVFDGRKSAIECMFFYSGMYAEEKVTKIQDCDFYLVDDWTPGTLAGCVDGIQKTNCQHTNLKHTSGLCYNHNPLVTAEELQTLLGDKKVRYMNATKKDGSEKWLKFDYKIA